MPANTPTLASDTVGGRTRARGQSEHSRPFRYNRINTRSKKEILTGPIKIALQMILTDGKLTRAGNFWYGAGRSRIAFQTIEAMYSRALCKIVTDSRHRRKQFAELTELGLRVARDLKRERDMLSPELAPDDFDARNMLVYPEGEE